MSAGYELVTLRENYLAGGSDSTVPSIGVLAASLAYDLTSKWRVSGDFRHWVSYGIADAALPTSEHDRVENWAELQVDNYRRIGLANQRLSFGYFGRFVQVQNTFVAPQPSYLFSLQQVFHGPTIGGLWTYPTAALVRSLGLSRRLPWGMELDLFGGVKAHPVLFNTLDPQVPSIGYVWGAETRVGFKLRRGPLQADLGFDWTTFRRAQSPFQDFWGPELAVVYRF